MLMALVVTLSPCMSTARAAISPKSFFCSRAIEFDDIEKASLVAVPLADEMYETLNRDLSDLCVFDDQGNPVASLVLSNFFMSDAEKFMDVMEKEYVLPAKAVQKKLDEQQGDTLITINTKKMPITMIKLDTPDRNFHRAVDVLVQVPGSQRWQAIKSDEISRIDLEGLEKENLTLTFGEQRAAKIRLRIHHGESRPIEIEKVQLFGPVYECRFIAEPKRKYNLEYGSTETDFGPFDTAALDAAQNNNLRPITARLSEKVLHRDSVQSAAESERAIDAFLTSPWLIYPSVILLILLLGLGLFYAAKRMPVGD